MSVYIPTHISTTSPLLDISNLLLLPVKRANLSFPTIWNAIFVMYQIIVCIQVPYLTLTLFWNFCWLFLLVYFSLYIFFRIILSNSNKNLTGNFGEGIVSNLQIHLGKFGKLRKVESHLKTWYAFPLIQLFFSFLCPEVFSNFIWLLYTLFQSNLNISSILYTKTAKRKSLDKCFSHQYLKKVKSHFKNCHNHQSKISIKQLVVSCSLYGQSSCISCYNMLIQIIKYLLRTYYMLGVLLGAKIKIQW